MLCILSWGFWFSSSLSPGELPLSGELPVHFAVSSGLLVPLWFPLMWKCHYSVFSVQHIFYFFLIFKFIFRERGREGEREGKKHQCVVASHMSPTGGLACNPGICPDWESNQRALALQGGTQSTEPHQPGQGYIFWVMNSSLTIFVPFQYCTDVWSTLFWLPQFLLRNHQ